MNARNAREKAWSSFGLHRSASAASEPMMRSASGSSSTLGWSRSWCAARRIATRCAVRLNLPSCILRLNQRATLLLASRPRRLALLARTDFAQELPGVNAQVVVIVPLEFDGVLADALSGNWLGGRFEHGQRPGSESGSLPKLPSSLGALFFAHRAGAGIAEEHKAVMRNVAVGPLNVDARAGCEIHLDRLRVCARGRRLKRGLHDFSIA